MSLQTNTAVNQQKKNSKGIADSVHDNTQLLTERQAAVLYNYSRFWFQKKRWKGGGPPYKKIGVSVRYPAKELAVWFDSFGLQHTTSEGTA
jgi:hypothetical protein